MAAAMVGHNLADGQDIPIYVETDIIAGKGDAVPAGGIVLVSRPGILLQNFNRRAPLAFRQDAQPFLREYNLQFLVFNTVCESADSLRMAVGVPDIGLDIENRRSVEQVRSGYVKNRTNPLTHLNLIQLYGRQADRIGPEGRAGGKDADMCPAAKTRRINHRRPACSFIFGKLPDQPEMRVPL